MDKLEQLRRSHKVYCNDSELRGIIEFFEIHESEVTLEIKRKNRMWIVQLK